MLPVDLSNCETEPIHLPDAIQAFGILLALDEVDGHVSHWSANAGPALGVAGPLGRLRLLELFGEESVRGLGKILPEELSFSGPHLRTMMKAAANGQVWEVFPHRHAGKLILELEPYFPEKAEMAGQATEDLCVFVARMHEALSIEELCETAAREIRSLTGYDRAMIYKFHEDSHGEVVAESKADGLDSFLGLHYPASDIPRQARRIFLNNAIRMIPDVGYDPIPLIGPGRPPLDLSRSMLRSVSKIHIEYLINMGATASLTISLVNRGVLWGLIACHHYSSPRMTPPWMRGLCAVMGRLVSAWINGIEEREKTAHRTRVESVIDLLAGQMRGENDVPRGLLNFKTTLLDIVAGPDAGVAIHFDKKWSMAGLTPSLAEIEGLARWIGAREDSAFFHTDSVSALYPEAARFMEVASGVLSVAIPRDPEDRIIWFRPQWMREVRWGGNPEKAVLSDGVRLHPRKSFAAWKEIIQGRAMPWKDWELSGASELRNVITGIDLRRQFQLEQEARKIAESEAKAREELLAVVSHDLKNPLTSIRVNLGNIRRILPVESLARAQKVLDQLEKASERMKRLIEDLLDMSKIEAGQLPLLLRKVSARELLNECLEMFAALAREKSIHLYGDFPEAEIDVRADRERILQALSNLVGNALKFTRPAGTVVLSYERLPTEACFSVADTGSGIRAEDIPYVFDRYWQGKEARAMGSGLGLAISKGIIETHGGRIWVKSELGRGTIFYFTLPLEK